MDVHKVQAVDDVNILIEANIYEDILTWVDVHEVDALIGDRVYDLPLQENLFISVTCMGQKKTGGVREVHKLRLVEA